MKFILSNQNLEEPLILKQWKNILQIAEKQDLNSCFEECLKIQDDLYLLRLLCITGTNCLGKIKLDLAKRLLMRVNMITRSHQIQNLCVNLIKNCSELKIFNKFTKDDQNDILTTLFEISKLTTKVGSNAEKIYNSIRSNLD